MSASLFAPPPQAAQALPAGEQELKFHVPRHRSETLRRWLEITLRPHPKFAVSTLCSLYFDTEENASLHEKTFSYYSKTKYRLRWYEDGRGNPLPVPAFIEIKAKQGAVRHKYRSPLPVSARELCDTPLDAPLFESLFRSHCPREGWLPCAPLKPVLELRYQRNRYEHPLFPEAFCLDSHIRCTRTNLALLPPAQNVELTHDVFEQKGGSTDLVPVLRALPRFGAQRASISKYFLTVMQLLPDDFHA
ncbi:MAG: hypothetical protein JWO08_4268 [Verrucomicrobiaceae bacterium]|nr:hypothetical protein [Verrucomicrobiaceae bacterium]